MLYEGLTHIEQDGSLSLALAERIEILEGETVYLFSLRQSLYSDGTPLTAHHFESSWKEALSPSFASRSAHLFFPIKNARKAKAGLCSLSEVGIEAVDATHLKVTLASQSSFFLKLTAHPVFSPVCFSHSGTNSGCRLLASGPFITDIYQKGKRLSLKKNPHFYKHQEVGLDRVEILFINSEATALELFKKQRLDWIGGDALSPSSLLP